MAVVAIVYSFNQLHVIFPPLSFTILLLLLMLLTFNHYFKVLDSSWSQPKVTIIFVF